MLFGLFARKSEPVEVRNRKYVNFKFEKGTEKDAEKQLLKFLSDIEDETGLKAEVKKITITSLGCYTDNKARRSCQCIVDFIGMTQGKEKREDAANRMDYNLNEVDENTRRFSIEYMN